MNDAQLSLLRENGQASRISAREERLRKKPAEAGDYISSVWSFGGVAPAPLYRWYGTLPRGLVERLLGLYGVGTQTGILDPFVGTGTTLDVAADLGIPAVGLDSNPLACLITDTLLSGVPDSHSLFDAVEDIARRSAVRDSRGDRGAWREWAGLLRSGRYDYTRKWFREDAAGAMLSLLFEIAELESRQVQRFLFVAAAQVVRAVASVDARCTHHLVTKKKPFVDPVPLWRTQVSRSVGSLRSQPADPEAVSVDQVSVFDANLRPDSADFVLIHPPYPGVVHYHLVHRLATDLLDIVNLTACPVSIQKYRFGHEEIKAADVSTDGDQSYRRFVERLAALMGQVVAPEGRCAVIIGDQRHKGHLRHPRTDFVNSFEDRGLVLEETFIWVLQNNAGMHVLRRGHFIDHNYILVFHKTAAE